MRRRIHFLCTGNSCRSQMAEGWANHLATDELKVFSAGVKPKGLDPRAVRAMAEVGIDIACHRSKQVRELLGQPSDAVITVCNNAAEKCSDFPAMTRVFHSGFDDSPRLSQEIRYEEEAMARYRRVRDEIRDFVAGLPGGLGL